jgi:hypothetical protein
MFDVLEHIEKGRQLEMLRAINSHLTTSGFVIMQIPNAISPIGNYMRYNDFTHYMAYTQDSISMIMHNCGLHHYVLRPQYKHGRGIRKLISLWDKIYRMEIQNKDFILTPNIIVIAFKDENLLKEYIARAPEIKNDYMNIEPRGFINRIRWRLKRKKL